MVEAIDKKISGTTESAYELLKIDVIDLKVASWIQEKHPKALRSFLQFIAGQYAKKDILIDIDRLYKELMEAMR